MTAIPPCHRAALATGVFTAILAGFLITGAAARTMPTHSDPFEPAVTPAEARLLTRVTELAATNAVAALALLEQAPPTPAGPAIAFARGNLYVQLDRLDDAAEAYQQAIEHLPRFRAAIMNLGRVYLIQNRIDAAIDLYQQLVRDGQATASIYLLLGHAFLLREAPVSAETAYRQALLRDRQQTEAMTGLAKALIRQARHAEALALVVEILRLSPLEQELWTLRANALLAMNREPDALVVIEQARRLHCAGHDLLATLGDLYLNRDQPEEALAAYQEAFEESTPDMQRLLRAAEGFLAVENTEGADALLQTAMSRFEQEEHAAPMRLKVHLLRLRGQLARMRGDMDVAAERYREVLRQDPLDGRTMLLLGALLEDQDQQEDAMILYEQAARVEGMEADALVRQARLKVQREQYDQAIRLLEAAQTFRDQPHVARFLEQLRRMRR